MFLFVSDKLLIMDLNTFALLDEIFKNVSIKPY